MTRRQLEDMMDGCQVRPEDPVALTIVDDAEHLDEIEHGSVLDFVPFEFTVNRDRTFFFLVKPR